jgi:hypothetical protein
MQALYCKRSCFSVLIILGILSFVFLGSPSSLQAAHLAFNSTTGKTYNGELALAHAIIIMLLKEEVSFIYVHLLLSIFSTLQSQTMW